MLLGRPLVATLEVSRRPREQRLPARGVSPRESGRESRALRASHNRDDASAPFDQHTIRLRKPERERALVGAFSEVAGGTHNRTIAEQSLAHTTMPDAMRALGRVVC